MSDIMMVFACLSQSLDATELRQLTRVTQALLAMSGRGTMRGLSRWTGKGGSYRTVQRFFNTALDWGQLQWLVIRTHLLEAEQVLLVSGDHVVVTKAGKRTHGLDRFFSSRYGKAVPGRCFLSLSVISVQQRKSSAKHSMRRSSVTNTKTRSRSKGLAGQVSSRSSLTMTGTPFGRCIP